MRNKIVVGLMVLLVAGAASIGLCTDVRAPLTGSFVGQNFAYTNLTGARLELTFVGLSGTFDSGTNCHVTVTQGGQSFILYKKAVTNTVYWTGSGTVLERNGILTFFASSSAVATNQYRIEGK